MTGNAVEIRGLEKRYPNFALGPVDLTVPKGAIYGLIGPNGAGKTTTLDMILGLGGKDAGEIKVLGLDHLEDEVAMKRRVGYVSPDLNYAPWGKVKRAVSFIRAFYPDWDDAYCTRLIESLGIGWTDRIVELSFGGRIKLALILALSHRPDLLILDEPLVGLDAVSKRQVFTELLAAVQNDNRTVLISSHNLADLERFTDHIGMIKNGKMLLEGTTNGIVERYRTVDFICANGSRLASTEGIFVQQHEGERWRVVMDTSGGQLERVRAQGAQEIAETPVTLEDLFVALAS
jgi:ABC-2 type transport system ATP-binding protein